VAIQVPPGGQSPDFEYSASSADNTGHPGPSRIDAPWWNLLECARALRRRQVPLLWTTGIGIAAAILASAIQPRMYQSRASIQIQGVNENFLSLREVFPTTAPSADNAIYVQTQAEVLRQDALIEQVVSKLHLEGRPDIVGESTTSSQLGEAPSSRTADTWAAVRRIRKNLQIVPLRGSSVIQIVCEARDPRLAADIANTLAQTFIGSNIEARQLAARETFSALSRELEELRTKLADSQAKLAAYDSGSGSRRGKDAPNYEMMQRELAANRQFYDVISRRADEARLASTVSQPNVLLIGPAEPAARPYKPNLPLNAALGAFAGLALGIGFVMLREQTSSVLRAPGEASTYLSVPELGAIPRARNRRFLVLRPGGGALAPVERATLEQASSGVSESFRATVASILATSHNGDHPRVLLVTSSRPMEGKTTVASNLAIALAEIGSKVLLIDGDLRRPRLHKVFDQANSWGLSNLLREKNAVEELPLEALVKKTGVPRLYLLPSGTSADNISALLWSGRMARLLPRFRQEFDYVLMDAPPCLEFADARIMGRYAERSVLVVRADYTERSTVQAAVQRLSLDGIPVMGVIFNYWDPSSARVYGYAHCRQDLA